MITITFLGLDQFVVGHYSKEHSANLASLFEIEEDQLDFLAPNLLTFHQGVEQTSWNTLVKVYAPEEAMGLEDKVAKYLMETVKDFSINVKVVFEYYHRHHLHEYVNEDYPRFITESNIVKEEEEYYEEEEVGDGADPRDRSDLDPYDENQIYLGNAFEGFEGKLEKARKEKLDKDKGN